MSQQNIWLQTKDEEALYRIKPKELSLSQFVSKLVHDRLVELGEVKP